MITYTQHPQFDFDILVDIYSNRQLVLPLSITNVTRRLWGDECIAKIDGYVTVDVHVPIDATAVFDCEPDLLEVVQEAQRRNITSVKTHCVFSVMLDGRAYKAVECGSSINMSRYFDVEMVGYVMNDIFITDLITTFENELHSYATYYITCFMNESYSNRANLMITRKGLW